LSEQLTYICILKTLKYQNILLFIENPKRV
jgi:hypothetical protein